MKMQRGFRDKLNNHLDTNKEINVSMNVNGGSVYDYCCFGVDANGKLSDDAYMVFYNQLTSPNNEITFKQDGNKANYSVNLSALPQSIDKLVFTLSIDGNGNMSSIDSYTVSVQQDRNSVLDLVLHGSDFKVERAIIAIEIYRKGEWRIAAVASGFNGGLRELLKAYGGEEAYPQNEPQKPMKTVVGFTSDDKAFETAQTTDQAPQKISLEKKLEQGAPQLVSLAKPLKVELEKRNLLDCIAKVGLVLDISGSMQWQYENGTVQEIVNKVLPLAVQFDDDGELDFWYYGSRPKRMPSVNMSNYKDAVPTGWAHLMTSLGYGNDEPKVMREVLDEYSGSKLPAYVIFITDGGVGSENAIKKLLIEASTQPIFWQFVGVGGAGYGILERLDTMSGRYVDNANFFALDDFKLVSNTDLYSRLLNEFPMWLKEIKSKKMV